MSLPVHHVASLAGVTTGAIVRVEGDEAHHAVAVRRLRVGERVALCDGRGTTAVGVVAAAERRLLSVEVASVVLAPGPDPQLVVVQALPKGERGELAVEVLTEVGADRIVPWAAARSVARWSGERGERSRGRWERAALEAGKQARRSWFPVVAPLASTSEVADLIASADLAVVLHEDAAARLPALDVPRRGRLLVVVGPEGGLTDAEVATFEASGGVAVRLGAEVLRTSTAGVAAAAALLSRTPRWA